MEVVQFDEGLWGWASRHPAWRAGCGWNPVVWSTYYEAPAATVVIDPLVPVDPSMRERFWRALDRDVEGRGLPVAILVTCGWHVRSSAEVQRRYDARIWAPDPGGVRAATPAHAVLHGEAPVVGVRASDTGAPAPNREVAYLLEPSGVLVAGDLLQVADGNLVLAPAEAHDETPATRAWFAERARSVARQLLTPAPVLVLTGHGHAGATQIEQLRRELASPAEGA